MSLDSEIADWQTQLDTLLALPPEQQAEIETADRIAYTRNRIAQLGFARDKTNAMTEAFPGLG